MPDDAKPNEAADWFADVAYTARRHPVLAAGAVVWLIIMLAGQTLQLLVNLRVAAP